MCIDLDRVFIYILFGEEGVGGEKTKSSVVFFTEPFKERNTEVWGKFAIKRSLIYFYYACRMPLMLSTIQFQTVRPFVRLSVCLSDTAQLCVPAKPIKNDFKPSPMTES